MKREYTQIKAIEPRIVEMRKAGRTRQEIADELGLSKKQVMWWVSRYNRRICLFANCSFVNIRTKQKSYGLVVALLLWWRRTMINAQEIENIKNIIVQTVSPQQIYLFGSFANGTQQTDSDYDFYVVVSDESAVSVK